MSDSNRTPKVTVAQVLDLLRPEGFIDQRGRAWVTLEDGGRTRSFCGSQDGHALKTFVRRFLDERFGRGDDTSMVKEVLSAALSRAELGSRRDVPVRLASLKERFYLDLGRHDGAVVEIATSGWDIIAMPRALTFERSTGMLPLPLPSGERRDLRTELSAVLGNDDEDTEVLSAAYLIGCMNPDIPVPVLEVVGPQGSAKTSFTGKLRNLVDPNIAPVRRVPKDERDLFIIAANSWLVCFDNVSSLPAWFSDAACTLATGGGYATRKLYSDDQEMVIQVRRPVMVNSISEVVTRPDLRDRALTIRLRRITAEQRLTEEEVWRSFCARQSHILAALLDSVSEALIFRDAANPPQLPRMADWFRWVVAASEGPSFGFPSGLFEQAYARNREMSREVAIDASPVGRHVLALMTENSGSWSGTMTKLLNLLSRRAQESERRSPDWPKSPEALRHAIDRIAPDLASGGLNITSGRSSGRNHERIAKLTLGGPQ